MFYVFGSIPICEYEMAKFAIGKLLSKFSKLHAMSLNCIKVLLRRVVEEDSFILGARIL